MSNDCGCCTVVSAEAQTENRPWLSAVAYRIGTFASFRQALIDELSHTPELAGLSARVSDDYTVTAIELWAAVADVLTFYQERIANEAFLRTATLRDSVLRLVRLIDYQLATGAAATTQLAFTLEAGARALIPVGTRTQSVPGEGEKPQKFETLAAFVADARFNKLRLEANAVKASPTSKGATHAIVAPDADAVANAATLATGDRVLLYAPTALEELTVRDVKSADDLLTVRWQAPIAGNAFDSAFDGGNPQCRAIRLGRSVHLFGYDAPEFVVVSALKTAGDPKTAVLVQATTDFTISAADILASRISLDARHAGITHGSVVLAVASSATGTVALPFVVATSAERLVIRTATGVAPVVTANAQSGTVTQLTLTPFSTPVAYSLASLLPAGADIRNIVIHELIGDPLRFWPYEYPNIVASSDVYVSGRRNGWSSIEVGRTIERGKYKPGTSLDAGDLEVPRAVLVTDANGGAPVGATIAAAALTGLDISVQPTATDANTIRRLGLASDQAVAITALVSASLTAPVKLAPAAPRELLVSFGTLPPQTIALGAALPSSPTLAQIAAAMETAIRGALPSTPSFAHARVFVASPNALAVTSGVASDHVSLAPSASDTDTVVALGFDSARVRWLDGLLSGKITSFGALIVGSARVRSGIDQPVDLAFGGAPASVAQLAGLLAAQWPCIAIARDDGRYLLLPLVPAQEPRSFVHLSLALDTAVVLDASSAVLLGNVASASHGETVHNEVVGDGDASQSFQKFTLRKKPLTYTPSAVPGGVSSSLTLLVNGVRWSERPTLFGAGRNEQIYITRTADDGTTSVQFGDGVTGARLPSGRQNIVAKYRQGLGVAGRVGASKISTLLDRPTGVKSVINPLAADGGADPETMARARGAAPGTVRTFGRAVSLRDFEDSALMAGEVAKATATWVWAGERRAIHLTIAAQGGAVFSANGMQRIVATLLTERDPNHKLLIANYSAVAVLIDATILVDDRYVAVEVLAAARAAMLADMSFDNRRFAQPVYLSEVFAVLQNVAGVVAVDVNTLDLKSSDIGFRAAHGIVAAAGQLQPQLVMLPARPAGIGVVLPAELAWLEVPAQDLVLHATGGLAL